MTGDADSAGLILASGSPRRGELLSGAGYSFRGIAPIDEEPAFESTGLTPIGYAKENARRKAESVVRGGARGLILAADTIVVLGEAVYGKPADVEDARRILSALAGTTHEVITAVVLRDTEKRSEQVRHDVTRVTMKPMTREELDAYLATGLWRGKAGAYGIQDENDAFVERFEGSFSNVVGLPIDLVARMFHEIKSMGTKRRRD